MLSDVKGKKCDTRQAKKQKITGTLTKCLSKRKIMASEWIMSPFIKQV